MAVAKAVPVAAKTDLVGVVRRAARVVVEKARGLGVVGLVVRVDHLVAVAVTGLPSSQSRRYLTSCLPLRIRFAAFFGMALY